MGDDGITLLEHDHVPLSLLVADLRTEFHSVTAGKASPGDVYGAISDALPALEAALFEHFSREEEGLFPFVLAELPTFAAEISATQLAHDAICGSAARLARSVDRGPKAFSEQFSSLHALFERFDASYASHAREECAMLRRVGEALSPAQRGQVARLLEGL